MEEVKGLFKTRQVPVSLIFTVAPKLSLDTFTGMVTGMRGESLFVIATEKWPLYLRYSGRSPTG